MINPQSLYSDPRLGQMRQPMGFATKTAMPGGRQREMQKNNPPPNYFPNGGEPVTNMPMPQQPPQQSNNYQANVDFMNQMAKKNAQVGANGSSIHPSFSYDPKTNQYMQDSSAFGLTGDAANTYYSPEGFQSKFGKTLGKMPSQGGGDDLVSDMRYRGKDGQGGGGVFGYPDPNLGQPQGGRDQGPIGTGVPASDVPAFDPSYNSGIAGGMQQYGGSYSSPGGGIPNNSPLPPSGGKGGATPPPAMQQSNQPNMNTIAANGIRDAIGGARDAMNYRPSNVQGGGYNPATMSGQGYNGARVGSQGYGAAQAGSQGFNAAGVGSQGYNSAQATSQGYGASLANSQGYNSTDATGRGYTGSQIGAQANVNADNVAAGQLAKTDLSAYTNPYDSQVIDNAVGDLDRARKLSMNDSGARATAQGAFGGSRHGLMEAETNKNFYDSAGKVSSNLRQQGFMNAQNMANTDIGRTMQADLANQGANMQANTFNANLGQQRNLANQSSTNQANQFSANAANQASAQNAAQRSAASQFGASASNQASLANQNAQNRASEFGANAANNNSQFNANSRNQASQFGADAANRAASQASQQQQSANLFGAQAANNASQFNANSNNQASQFGAQAANNASLANQASANAAGQFNANAQNAANANNMNAYNQAGQFNSNLDMQAQLANQQAGLQGAGQSLSSANSLGALSNLGFGMGQTVNNNMARDGMLQQALMQQLIGGAQGQMGGYNSAPYNSIGLLSQALGASPIPQSTTNGFNPGLFNYLQMGANMYGGG